MPKLDNTNSSIRQKTKAVKLTKENFHFESSGDLHHSKIELAHHPRYTSPWTNEECFAIVRHILKNQSIVEKIKRFGDAKGSDKEWAFDQLYQEIIKFTSKEKSSHD